MSLKPQVFALDEVGHWLTSKQVRYANANGIPFLATTGLHGGTNTLGNLHQGINIRMRKLNTTTIAKDGRSATFGGGILGLEVRDALWAAGKQTGNCHRSKYPYAQNKLTFI
jgi:FAD/FMN-containing dehydrogenase